MVILISFLFLDAPIFSGFEAHGFSQSAAETIWRSRQEIIKWREKKNHLSWSIYLLASVATEVVRNPKPCLVAVRWPFILFIFFFFLIIFGIFIQLTLTQWEREDHQEKKWKKEMV